MKPKKPLTVYLEIEGGVVNVANKPKGLFVDIIDHDVEGTPPEDNDNSCHCEEGGGTYHSHWTV